MIARLTGSLVHRDLNRGIVDVQGVGYAVFAPNRSLDTWATDEPVVVHVSTQVREDAITLYGFADDMNRQAFDVLLGVSGVGPKMALATLDAFDVDQLAQAVEADDVVALTGISGVGKKTAQRLALELKGKLPVTFEVAAKRRATAGRRPADPLRLALAQLQYGKAEIDLALRGLDQQGIGTDVPTGQRLKAALSILSQG